MMETFSLSLAQRYKLQSRIDNLNLDPDAGNQEANARRHRYQLFASALGTQDALLTAHHMNDQAETLLLNMMRGSGASGLRAIALKKKLGQGYLFRPLLNTTREEIEGYARSNDLEWIEDPSNESLQFDRNYIRHSLMPVLQKRWPAAVRQMHRVCEWQNESHSLMTELAKIDYAECKETRPFSEYSCLSIKRLITFSRERQKNLIRHWLKIQTKSVIGHKKLDQLLSNLESRLDAMPVVTGDDYSIRQYQAYLYMVNDSAFILEPRYAMDSELDLPTIGLRLCRRSIFEKFQLIDQGQVLEILFRTDTSRQTQHGHRLKRLFQKNHVPPWIRPVTPQIVIDGELAGLWLV